MTNNEKEALINYIDHQMLQMCVVLEQYLDPDAIYLLYEKADALINDLEDTIAGHQMYEQSENLKPY